MTATNKILHKFCFIWQNGFNNKTQVILTKQLFAWITVYIHFALQTLVLIYLPRKDGSRVSLGGKEGYTNKQISAKPGIKTGILWLGGSQNCVNHAMNRENVTQFGELN